MNGTYTPDGMLNGFQRWVNEAGTFWVLYDPSIPGYKVSAFSTDVGPIPYSNTAGGPVYLGAYTLGTGVSPAGSIAAA